MVHIYWQSHLDKWAPLPKSWLSPLLNEDTKDTRLHGLTTGLKKKKDNMYKTPKTALHMVTAQRLEYSV